MVQLAKREIKNVGWLIAAILATILLVSNIFYDDGSVKTLSANEQPTSTTEVVDQNSEVTVSEDGATISYPGEDGKTALQLLKEKTHVNTKDSSFGEYVTAINGDDGGGSQYWLFYVNDAAATVGAGDYVTNSGDNVEWRLE